MLAPICLISLSFQYQPSPKKTFKQLQVLKGTWKMGSDKGDLYEQWDIANKTTLTGKSYMVRNGNTFIMENVLLHYTHENIFYSPVVNGQNRDQAIDFKLTSSAENRFVFENSYHDYPKRIVYHFVTNDSLHAWIDDGNDNGKKRSDFYYKRVN